MTNRVAFADMNVETAEATAKERSALSGPAGGEVIAGGVDVTSMDPVQAAVEVVENDLGPLGWSSSTPGGGLTMA